MSDADNLTTDNSTGAEQQSNAGEKRFTQQELEAILADRLDRQKKALAAHQQKQREDAERAQLQEQQEYKQLAEQLAEQVATLEPLSSKLERYEAVITARLENERAGLPKPIVALLSKMDLVDQLEWIEHHKAEITKPAAVDMNATNRGVRPNTQDRIADVANDLRHTGKYNLF